jgi:hypothetical protein
MKEVDNERVLRDRFWSRMPPVTGVWTENRAHIEAARDRSFPRVKIAVKDK